VVVVDCGVAVGNAGCDCANESVAAATKRKDKDKDRFFTWVLDLGETRAD